jgi:hypothetical protein
VKKGEVLCIIEAMKLMNDRFRCDGEIANIYVENGQPVNTASGCSRSGRGKKKRAQEAFVARRLQPSGLFKKILIANRGEVACASSTRVASWASRPSPSIRRRTRTSST